MKTSRVIEENGDRCVYCGFKVRFDVENVPQLDGFLATKEHLLPQNKGGGNDPDNLVTCCKWCNSTRGDMDIEEFRQGLLDNKYSKLLKSRYVFSYKLYGKAFHEDWGGKFYAERFRDGKEIEAFKMNADLAEEQQMESIRIDAAKRYVKAQFSGNSGGHDVEHTMRVYRNAKMLAEKERKGDQTVIKLAALLHDVDDPKLFKTKNNANARTFLATIGITCALADQICETINAVSFSQNKGKRPETIEAMIVQDADRLDAMGAIGIARTFAYGGEHGRPLTDSVKHFYDKLLLLKDLMNTETGKKIAERRHKYLLGFLKELEDDTGD